MIKNIIFDIGNVLANFCWDEYYRGLGFSEEMVERLGDATVRTPFWPEFDRGVMSEEEVIESMVRNTPSLEMEIRRVFVNMHGIVTRRDYAIPWIKELQAAGYKCYCLSNFTKKVEIACAEALDFLEYLDGGILSYKDKVIKPYPEIYELLLNRYHLKAEECVFMDDTEKNLPPAGKLGMRTIWFQSREQAVRELENLGVNVRERIK